ncbi:unnamed protein product [marine sediment metagenome]|uniref:Uncharacterized protein n=1 Tax=marine sediment metagenome TaxID=412755 RepID=X1QSC1_9ZZZZ
MSSAYEFRGWLNHAQTIQLHVPTKIELDQTSYDPDGCFELSTRSYVVKENGDYLIIGGVWYDYGAVDGGIYSVQVRKNNSIIMERDGMCAHATHKDIQPHATDIWPLQTGDKISLWTVYYHGGPCPLRIVERQNYLTIRRLGG